jgi:hypothetical protein
MARRGGRTVARLAGLSLRSDGKSSWKIHGVAGIVGERRRFSSPAAGAAAFSRRSPARRRAKSLFSNSLRQLARALLGSLKTATQFRTLGFR